MLNKILRQLADVYRADVSLDVYDFLITDKRFDDRDEPHSFNVSAEKSTRDDKDIALYIQRDILDLLECDDPMVYLHEDNINAYLIALEGVSHLLYLAWNAQYDRAISLFDLELQAEVDKYIVTMILLAKQEYCSLPRDLLRRLFSRYTHADDATQSDKQKNYKRANYYAYHYCKALRHNCMNNRRASFFSDLRRFYRLTNQHKINHIVANAHLAL